MAKSQLTTLDVFGDIVQAASTIGNDSTLTRSRPGLLSGVASSSGGFTSLLEASAAGSFASGFSKATSVNSVVSATGLGSASFGYALNETISSTATNAFQFGPGTNSTSTSLQVGNAASAGVSIGSTGITSAGNIMPEADNTRSIGTQSVRFAEVNTRNLFAGVVSGTGTTVTLASNPAVSAVVGSCIGGTGCTSKLLPTGDGSVVFGQINGLTLAGPGVGSGTTSNQEIWATGTGSIAHGSLGSFSNSGTPFTMVNLIKATGNGSFAGGAGVTVSNSGNGLILAAGNGSIAHGSLSANGFTRSINANGVGSFAMGEVTKSALTAQGTGSFAMGFAGNTGDITATGTGSFAMGFTAGTGGIIATGSGSSAFGFINASTGGSITSVGKGSFAFGCNYDSNSITSTGKGSLAIGYIPLGGVSITATPDNSWQFGPGTNGVAGLQVGDAQTEAAVSGVLLKANGRIDVLSKIGVGLHVITNIQDSNMTLGTMNSGSGRTTTFKNVTGSLMGGSLTAAGTAGSAATIKSDMGPGNFIFGSVASTVSGAYCYMKADMGSWVGGAVLNSTTSDATNIIAGASGAFAHGQALNGGKIKAGMGGTHVFGNANSLGYLHAHYIGSFVTGYVKTSGVIASSSHGSFATGFATGIGSSIVSGTTSHITGYGNFSGGAATGGNSITSSGAAGSFAFGSASAAAITASGEGSLAIGKATGAITASVANAFQFGPGVNAQTLSLQVGAVGAGIRLLGAGVGSTPQNGDIWCDGTYVWIRSDGASHKLKSDHTWSA